MSNYSKFTKSQLIDLIKETDELKEKMRTLAIVAVSLISLGFLIWPSPLVLPVCIHAHRRAWWGAHALACAGEHTRPGSPPTRTHPHARSHHAHAHMHALSSHAYDALIEHGRQRKHGRQPVLDNELRNLLLERITKVPYLSQSYWACVDLLEGTLWPL